MTKPSVVLGVVVAPGLAEDVTAKIAADLADDLEASYGAVDWRTELHVDRLVQPPAPLTEIFDAARRRLLEDNWDLGVVVTDLPLRSGRRPLSRHISPTHGIAVVSLPALGAIHLRQRLRRTLLELVGELVGEDDRVPHSSGRLARLRRRWGSQALRELAVDRPAGGGLFTPGLLAGYLRLLLGMVRANRPWRLVARLYSALVAALAVGALGIVTADIWLISATMGWWRLAVTCVVSIAVTIVAVIAVHGLWERAPDARVRGQVVLFNVATAATITIGILALYAALFVLILLGSALVLTPRALEGPLGHSVGLRDYVALAWFISSLATIGGALGAGLESDEAVREAAYAGGDRDERPEDESR